MTLGETLQEIIAAVDGLHETSERAPDVRHVPMRLVPESAFQRLMESAKHAKALAGGSRT
jgi:hypothetical protein